MWVAGLGHQQKALANCKSVGRQRLKDVFISQVLCHNLSPGFSPHVASYIPLRCVQQLCTWRRTESALLAASAVGLQRTGGSGAEEAVLPPACFSLHQSHVATLPRGPAPQHQQCVTSHRLGRSSPRIRWEMHDSSANALDCNVITDHTDSDL